MNTQLSQDTEANLHLGVHGLDAALIEGHGQRVEPKHGPRKILLSVVRV